MADVIKGLSIDIGLGTAKLDAGLKDLKGKMGALNSEMKANMSAFDRGEKSIQKYETQLTGLNKKLELQAAVTEKARKSYEKMVQEHGEGSKEADKAARAYNEEAAQLNNLQRYVDGVTQEMKEFAKQQEIAASGWTKFGNQMKDIGGKMKTMGAGMQDVGKKMSLAITAPIAGFGAAATKLGMDFDDTMAKVQAISGATGDDLDKLRDKAKEMGATTRFSASEAAQGLTYMAMAGWKTEDMLAGLDGVMNLAAASGEDLATVSDIVTDAMTAFGLSAEESGRFADVLASASSNANTNVSMLGGSFKYVAPVAGALGMSVEDTALALGLMANAGIKADQSGTALRTMLTNLAKPTKQMQNAMDDLGISLTNNDGSMKTLDEVMQNLRGSFQGLTKDQQASYAAAIFGKEAMSGALSIINASETDYNKLAGAIRNSNGAAEEMAATMEDTLAGVWREIRSGLEGFMIDLYEELRPTLIELSENVKDFVGWLNNLSPEAKKTGIAIAGIAAAAGPVLVGLGSLIVVGGNLVTIVGSISAAIGAAGGLTALLGGLGGTLVTLATGPVGLTVAAIAGLTTGAIALGKYLSGPAIEEVDLFGKELEGVSDSTKKALEEFWTLSDGVDEAFMEMKASAGIVTKEMRDTVLLNFEEMNGQIIDKMAQNYEDQKRIMLESFEGTRYLTDQERQNILKQMDTHYKIQTDKQEAQEARIIEIIETAYAEKRQTTEQEDMEINAIRAQMQDEAITQLSASATEEAVIRQRLADTAGDITAKQAADLIQKAAKVRDETIKAAEDEYDEKIATYTLMKDELGTLTQEQYETLVQKAKDQRDDTVAEAQGTYKDIYDETVSGNTKIKNQIDKDSGEILTRWQVFWRNMDRAAAEFGKDLILWQINLNGQAKQKWQEFSENAVQKFRGMQLLVEKIFGDMIKGAAELPGKIGQAIGNGTSKAVAGVRAMGNAMLTKLGQVVNGLIRGVNTITSRLGISGNIREWSPIPQYAKGTDGHPGGLAVVGDGTGALKGRELIQTPDGQTALSPDEPTVVNLPKGTHVLSAPDTKRLLGRVPKYANGTGIGGLLGKAAGKAAGFLSNVWDYAKNPSGLIDKLVSSLGLRINGLFGGAMSMASGAFKHITSKAVEYMKSMFQKAGDFSGGKFGPPFRLTSRAGWRTNPVTGQYAFHYGDDYGAPAGTPIPSQSSGVVTQAGWHDIRGNYVRVKSGAYELLYQHNTRNLVRRGQSVNKGQILGTVGSTGRSTGPHLHFEIWKNGQFIPPKSMGFATGGIVNKPTFATLAEEGYPEIVIPTAPNRRTDAMKLLAIAGRMVSGKDTSKRPNQIPAGAGEGNSSAIIELLLEQNQLLKALLQKDSNLYLDSGVLAGSTSQQLGSRQSLVQRMKGR